MDVFIVGLITIVAVPLGILASPIVVPYELYKEHKIKRNEEKRRIIDKMRITLHRLNI